MEKYVAFLRGINVGGHHKVPMADLRSELEKLNLKNVVTLLNSGNVLFESNDSNLENKISEGLEKTFGFPVPTIIRKFETIVGLLHNNPFRDIEITKDVRLYVTFLRKEGNTELSLPWKSPDNSFQIIEKRDSALFSVLDLSISESTKAMDALEKHFGKDLTTRNWNTIERIANKANE